MLSDKGGLSSLTSRSGLMYSQPMNGHTQDNRTWENLCEQCGTCCFEKLEDDAGTIFFSAVPCRYLDVVTRQCKVYERRFEINPDCLQLTPELVTQLHWLHDDCGYRKALGIKRRPGRNRKIRRETRCSDHD